MTFRIGPPPTSSSSSKALTSLNIVETIKSALPIGREAFKLLGGTEREAKKKAGGESDFPEDRIIIPVGITPQNLKNYTLYDILGFGLEWGASADTEAIKKAYHKAVLMYHPDKAQYKTADGKEDRTVFLKIQEAFTVLSNETKRRAYDSQLPFDESIPTEEKVLKAIAKGPHKFFKLFSPIFKRNARFAVNKPVPDLGDMDTPAMQVYKFYEYWVKFESWRDFTGIGAEHKPDDAQSREEKRWMQKENDRLAKKLKKKEMERLIALVALAEKFDPRIVADKEQRKNAKEFEKNAKEANAKKFAEIDAASKIWAEALEEKDKEKKGGSSKVDREKVKKLQSKARNTLRKLLRTTATLGHGSGEYGIVTPADVEILCTNCQMEEINDINTALGGDAAVKEASQLLETGFAVVHEKLAMVQDLNSQLEEDEKLAKEAKKLESDEKTMSSKKKAPMNANAEIERAWSEEEISALTLCVKRYLPGSAVSRWQLMANYLNVKLKISPLLTPEDCMRAAYKLAHDLN